MAELTTTAANVSLRASPSGSVVQYGETIAPPQPVYLKASDSKYWKADANVGAAEAAVVGIAMTPGLADEYGYMVTAGTIDVGATTVIGTTYILGAAQGWAPESDYASGWYKTTLGTAEDTAGKITLAIKATGALKV